jgi:SAM-dependent methyltransferase
VARWASRIPTQGRVLDLACGAGRHARYLADLGLRVDAVDRDIGALVLRQGSSIEPLQADLEAGGWPYPGVAFDGIVVTNYLHRPLFPVLLASLAPNGVLIYETFAVGNERFGKPSNPDFLLFPGELLEVVRGVLRVIAYEDVIDSHPRPAAVQRICAMRPAL